MDAPTKIIIGSQFGAWGEPDDHALGELVERAVRQPELLMTDTFRRRFARLVQHKLGQEGLARAEILDTVEDRLDDAAPGVAETVRQILAASLMPPAGGSDSALVPLLSRISGAQTPYEVGRHLLTSLKERFGERFSAQIWLNTPKPEVIATLDGFDPDDHEAERFMVQWADADAPLGHMVAHGLTSGQRERLSELAPWLQPTMKRLVETQQQRDSEQIYARQRRMWQIKAEMLDLAQRPQSSESYLRQVIAATQQLFGASQVVYWTYDDSDDSLSVSLRSRPEAEELDVPVSAGLFQEAVINRQVKTAALENGRGELRLFLLGPVFNENELEGVLQVILPTRSMGTEAEEDLALLTQLVASGLKTVRFYEQLSYHASHDPLTGLANRRTFEQFLSREFKLAERHQTPIALIMVDVDHFKRYNDTFGHPAGDALLRDLAGALSQAVRSTDFVARYGGEEFVIVLPHTGPEGARAVAGKVLESIRTLHERATVLSGVVTASVGVACFPYHGADMPQLIEAADQAMYQAKQTGRDQVRAAGEEA